MKASKNLSALLDKAFPQFSISFYTLVFGQTHLANEKVVHTLGEIHEIK
jgi:hypothetical protein